jgi:hypothetical protein
MIYLKTFYTSGFPEIMFQTSMLVYFDVRAIWMLSVGSNRFFCFVFMFIKVENPCSLSLLSHYPEEFYFYPTWGNLSWFADPWSRGHLVEKFIFLAKRLSRFCVAAVDWQ